MSTKPVECNACGTRTTVPAETTTITCPKCGNKFRVAYFGKIGGKWA